MSGSFDPENVGDDDLQLLEEILQRVQREHSDLKRRRFEHLLVCSWIDAPKLEFDERRRQVRALGEFDETHILILSKLAEAKAQDQYLDFIGLRGKLGLPVDIDNEILVPALDTLASGYGYIKRGWGMSDGESLPLMSGNLSPEGIARKCDHAITDSGQRFLTSVLVDENCT